jgi:hypothetical protein
MNINLYSIIRDHSNETGFFVVNEPEGTTSGFGFQINLFGTVYGISITV